MGHFDFLCGLIIFDIFQPAQFTHTHRHPLLSRPHTNAPVRNATLISTLSGSHRAHCQLVWHQQTPITVLISHTSLLCFLSHEIKHRPCVCITFNSHRLGLYTLNTLLWPIALQPIPSEASDYYPRHGNNLLQHTCATGPCTTPRTKKEESACYPGMRPVPTKKGEPSLLFAPKRAQQWLVPNIPISSQ